MRGWLIDMWQAFLQKCSRIHKSVHMWINGIIGSCVVIFPYIQDQMPLLQPYLSERIYLNAMMVIIVVNMILHFRKL